MYDIIFNRYYDLIVNRYNIAVIVIGGAVWLWFYFEYKKTKSRALLNCLPGVFTSLGLLGTFISICSSLHDIDSIPGNINSVASTGGQVFNIKAIIEELVPAFTSSICGLFCAFITTIWAKYVFAQEENAECEQLNNKSPEQYIQEIAENSFVLKSIDTLLSQINRQQAQLITMQEEQDKKYLEYNDKLNNNITRQNEVLKAFIDGFVNKMDDIFKQMHDAIEQQINNFGQEQFTKTSTLLETITDNLSKISTDIITQQKKSVETMLSQTNADINEISTSVTKNLAMLSTQLTVSLSTLGSEQGEKLNTLISDYSNLATKLSEQNSAFAEKVNTQMSEELEKVQQHNTESLKQMNELKDTYKDITTEMLNKALSMNETTSTNIRKSLGKVTEDIQSAISEQCATLGKAITDNVDSLNKAYSFIESLVAEIKQNYDQAVLAYGNAVDVAHRTNESAEKAISATNKSLTFVEETNTKIGSVLDLLTERQENIECLTKQIVSTNATIESLQKLESTLNKLVNK